MPVNEPPNIGNSRIRLTPLALAILMGRDDNVSSLLNVQADMLVYRETVYPVENEQENIPNEEDPTSEGTADETATSEGQVIEDKPSQDGSAGNASAEEFDSVVEDIALQAIDLAASHGNAQTTKFLLLQCDRDSLAPNYCLLHDAAEFGHAESVDILINWGADIEERNPYYSRTPLVHSAALNTDIAKIETLIRRRATVDAQDKDSKTAARYAAVNNRLDMVQKLVEAGANLEIEDSDGNTLIHFMVEQPEYYALAKYMVQKGVSLKHKNKAGGDPFNLALNAPADKREMYLILAVSSLLALFLVLLRVTGCCADFMLGWQDLPVVEQEVRQEENI